MWQFFLIARNNYRLFVVMYFLVAGAISSEYVHGNVDMSAIVGGANLSRPRLSR
jgi:hypothetical protein